jgi:hypothetical protein
VKGIGKQLGILKDDDEDEDYWNFPKNKGWSLLKFPKKQGLKIDEISPKQGT